MFNKHCGNSTILSLGIILVMFMMAPFAIDLPTYYNVETQLQTATDAAALAGASKLNISESAAEAQAYEVASMNWVAGRALKPTELTYVTNGYQFQVIGKTTMPTITERILCGLTFTVKKKTPTPSPNNSVQQDTCDTLTVVSHSKAVSAARDIMLIIDNSGSMGDSGNRPMNNVITAADEFMDILTNMNANTQYGDKVGLVSFNTVGTLQIGLTDRSGFSSVKSKINSLRANGYTNYYDAMRLAINELQKNGRPNTDKHIIFLSDGDPNYPEKSPYTRDECEQLFNKNKTQGKQCIQQYINNLLTLTQGQANRAIAMKVKIHTIEIGYDNVPGLGGDKQVQKILENPTWESGLIQYFSTQSGGQAYAAQGLDLTAVRKVFDEVAKIVRLKLSA